MASHSLRTASDYLNNLLLARGLLHDGKNVDFTQRSNDTNSSTRLINLVHDLVLRRDKDAEQLEALASSICGMRAEEAQRTTELRKLQDMNTTLTRTVATAEVQERSLKTAARKAEAQAKELREQMSKLRSTMDQVRAKCQSDVRKRDAELEKLKGHLTGLQRGKKEASGMKINILNPQVNTSKDKPEVRDVNSGDWSLEKETTDFLTALVNETSTENVALRVIVESAMDTLTQLTGLDQNNSANTDDGGIEIQKSSVRTAPLSQNAITSCETLASQMRTILEHCQTILKDPSFVPIEEVHIREEEIIKLRIGWEKMAGRWKEAVTMMDAWRRRMLEGSEDIDVHEFSELGFGRSMAVFPNGEPVLEADLSSILFDNDRLSTQDVVDRAEVDSSQDEESELDIPAPSSQHLSASPARRGIRLAIPTKVLQNNGNTKRKHEDTDTSLSHSGDSGIGSLDGSLDENDTFRQVRSKIPRHANPKELSVSEKLAAIEAEAAESVAQRVHEGTHKRKLKPKKSSRRRSTLSPEELAQLMGVR